MSSDEKAMIAVMMIDERWNPIRVKLLHPPWCHRQAILGTGPASNDPSCEQCPWRSSCGEVD